jgi:hypothetical protein
MLLYCFVSDFSMICLLQSRLIHHFGLWVMIHLLEAISSYLTKLSENSELLLFFLFNVKSLPSSK